MKNPWMRFAVFITVLSLCAASSAYSAKEQEKATPAKMISGYIWNILAKLKPRSYDSYYRVTAVIGVRGFSTAQPYEKSAFRFGALAAELQYAENIHDADRAKKTSELIMAGLKQADAALPSGDAPFPMEKLSPSIDNFVKEKKLDDFYQFGQWVGSLHMALLGISDDHADLAAQILGKESQAGYFLSLLKDRGLPPGVTNSLKKLDRMSNKSIYTERDVKEAISYLENIILLLG